MIKNLITPGQTLRRIMSKEVGQTYIFLGEDFFFQDIIIEGIKNVFLADEGEKINLIMGVDKEQDILNNLNMNSLFNQKSMIIVRNAKKISSKFHSELIDYFKSPISDKIVIFIYNDPYVSNKFVTQLASSSTCVDMRTPFKNKMKEWLLYYLKKNKINIPSHLLDQLIEDYGDNTNNVINEIDKLDIYSNGDINNILNINLDKKENQVWKLVDSIGRRDIVKSIDLYSSLHNSNVSLIKILINLLDLFRELINQKMNISTGKFIRNKIILKNLNQYGRQFSIDEILRSITILRDCDFAFKNTSIDERHLVHSILVDICGGVDV
tara:strand:+ start:399 stop:1370 length:972 start_codon:yes stop_codon:yes gene_type:complete